MREKIRVQLERIARNKGGDRYNDGHGFVIYIPQHISRPNDIPSNVIEITFETEE